MAKRYDYKTACEMLDFPGGNRLMAKFLRELGWIDQTGEGEEDIVDKEYIVTELHTTSPTGHYAVHYRTFLTDKGLDYLRPLVEKHKEEMIAKKKKK